MPNAPLKPVYLNILQCNPLQRQIQIKLNMKIEDIKKLSIVLEIADKIISSTILLTLIANNDISNLL